MLDKIAQQCQRCEIFDCHFREDLKQVRRMPAFNQWIVDDIPRIIPVHEVVSGYRVDTARSRFRPGSISDRDGSGFGLLLHPGSLLRALHSSAELCLSYRPISERASPFSMKKIPMMFVTYYFGTCLNLAYVHRVSEFVTVRMRSLHRHHP
jgi:hypothetical protein